MAINIEITIVSPAVTLPAIEITGPGGGTGGGSGAVNSVNGEIGVVLLTLDNIPDGTIDKGFTATEKTKLAGIETGATANSSDATLLARGNHTGTQTASTISDFNTAALTAAPAETTTTAGALINGATAKTTPVDADFVGLMDNAASNVLKKLSWANIKATLLTYFNSIYQSALTLVNASGASVNLTAGGNGSTFADFYVQASTGTNTASRIFIMPKGSGAGPDKSDLLFFGTDFIADQSNLEYLLVRADGLSYRVVSQAAGSGAPRPIVFSATGVGTSGQLDLNTDGSITSTALLTLLALASGVTAPITSGTKHMLTIDANGLVSHELRLETFCIPVGDDTTAITTGTAKATFRMPYAFTLVKVKASLTTASSSGNPAFDINESGVSILSTTLTIDATEKTSKTAATAAVISDTNLSDDAEITIDIDTAGTLAAGLKIYLIGYTTAPPA